MSAAGVNIESSRILGGLWFSFGVVQVSVQSVRHNDLLLFSQCVCVWEGSPGAKSHTTCR